MVLVMWYKHEAHSHMEFQVLTPKMPSATELGTSTPALALGNLGKEVRKGN